MNSIRSTVARGWVRCNLLLWLGLWLPASPIRAALPAGDPAHDAKAQVLAAGIRAFQSGFTEGDPAGLHQALVIFRDTCASHPDDFDAHYWRSAASLALVLRSLRADNADAGGGRTKLLEQAEDAARSALAIREQSGEVHAHLATVMGLRIAQRPSSAIWSGGALRRHARRAMALAPDNPRVLFLLGTGQARAPSPWGNPERALEQLLEAERRFAAEERTPATEHAPRWGHCHALHAIADLYVSKGLAGPARRYRERAVARCPNARFAQQAEQDATGAVPPP